MLILTRRSGETINIGNDITVTVLGTKGNQVRIGVNAPKEVAIHREENYERIKAEEQRLLNKTPARLEPVAPMPLQPPSQHNSTATARR